MSTKPPVREANMKTRKNSQRPSLASSHTKGGKTCREVEIFPAKDLIDKN